MALALLMNKLWRLRTMFYARAQSCGSARRRRFAAPEFEEQFEIALRAELEDGVRYGDKKTNVMTNIYAEEALQDVWKRVRF